MARAGLLAALALLVPAIAASGPWAQAEPEPHPIRFSAGADHPAAQRAGLVGPLFITQDGSRFTLHVHALSGGTVVVDDVVRLQKEPTVLAYRLQVAEALVDDLDPVAEAHVRLWTGPAAPASDHDPGVCAVLDLTRPAGTTSAGACLLPEAKLQLTVALDGHRSATGQATASLRPTGVLAAPT